jgi:hypothetical protein
MNPYRTHTRTRSGTGARLADYLRSRTAEHWAFFAAGFIAAALLT